MKFQEIDFHIELFKAYLEPKEARFAYLDRVKKKSGYPRKAFFAKLDQAFDTIREAWQNEYDLKTYRLIGELKDLALPISIFSRYPALFHFSMAFQGHIDKGTLEGLSRLKTLYKLFKMAKGAKEELPEEKPSEKSFYLEKSPLKKVPQIIIDQSIMDGLIKGLKSFFPEKENELEMLLNGKELEKKLVWPINQNQLVDLIKRLMDAKKINSSKTECKEWICQNFERSNGKNFNPNSVYDILTGKSKCTKNNRILSDLNFL
jgi:hypothetical protein